MTDLAGVHIKASLLPGSQLETALSVIGLCNSEAYCWHYRLVTLMAYPHCVLLCCCLVDYFICRIQEPYLMAIYTPRRFQLLPSSFLPFCVYSVSSAKYSVLRHYQRAPLPTQTHAVAFQARRSALQNAVSRHFSVASFEAEYWQL